MAFIKNVLCWLLNSGSTGLQNLFTCALRMHRKDKVCGMGAPANEINYSV